MPKLSRIDLAVCKAIHGNLQIELRRFLSQYGMKIVRSKAGFDSSHIKYTIETVLETVNGVSSEKAEWDSSCLLLGLKPSHYGKTFMCGGKAYKLVALQMRRRARPVVAERGDGKRFLFRQSDVRSLTWEPPDPQYQSPSLVPKTLFSCTL